MKKVWVLSGIALKTISAIGIILGLLGFYFDGYLIKLAHFTNLLQMERVILCFIILVFVSSTVISFIWHLRNESIKQAERLDKEKFELNVELNIYKFLWKDISKIFFDQRKNSMIKINLYSKEDRSKFVDAEIKNLRKAMTDYFKQDIYLPKERISSIIDEIFEKL